MTDSTLVLTAHPGDFVWRAAGAIALAGSRGRRVVIGCMSFGERGESASLWRKGYNLDQVKAVRRQEAEEAAKVLGAEIRFFDADDYPLVETPALLQGLIDLYREVQPAVVLTHAPADPYNGDHAFAHQIALKARILAQAPGVEGPGEVIGAPPVFCFEPHQPEQCGFVPNVLLDVTEVWERKREAMAVLAAQKHLHAYYTDLGKRRGLQAARNSGPNLGLPNETYGEAYMRIYPQVTRELS
ncbi:PIG-L deacetylase family protein [Actinoplanes regularis]|uniref:4-oxalomesaconate hydratase n=1 Tax=Actinoplanes regularis TaxID=52697 RepID=A0A238ZWH9_9ACTN|nr:PIG-L deacetylase family protein [Actinoplanes regularis]GIE90231.1 GlcNAc-PI de-N-acetylase [Actinoplanes regularis]GLW33150.1 GlcNAc-PI de-N-acetylase [Actinoplanes regularis]SNR87248.1 4-oxalomesaconate hydratase [Actinoplanes regularis]